MTPKVKPQATNLQGKIVDGGVEHAIDSLVQMFWNRGGKEKYFENKAARDANGIPDSQWLKAVLMGLIDDTEITFSE